MRRRAAASRERVRASQRTLFVLAGAIAAASCTSPAAVSRYAKSATLVTARLPDVAESLAASCRRTASYRLRRASNDWYGDDSLRIACASRDGALRGVLRANRALSAYFDALASLAANKVTDFDGEVDALGTAVRDAGGFDKAQVSAIEALAKYTASRTTDGYRRTKLREAI